MEKGTHKKKNSSLGNENRRKKRRRKKKKNEDCVSLFGMFFFFACRLHRLLFGFLFLSRSLVGLFVCLLVCWFVCRPVGFFVRFVFPLTVSTFFDLDARVRLRLERVLQRVFPEFCSFILFYIKKKTVPQFFFLLKKGTAFSSFLFFFRPVNSAESCLM